MDRDGGVALYFIPSSAKYNESLTLEGARGSGWGHRLQRKMEWFGR